MTILEFVKKYNIMMRAIKVNQNPFMDNDDWGKSATHWEVTFISEGNGPRKTFTTYYSMGSAHKGPPKSEDVLDSLILDADALHYTFEEWFENLGYDADSRHAFKTYGLCQEIGEKLLNFLGSEGLLELQECERL